MLKSVEEKNQYLSCSVYHVKCEWSDNEIVRMYAGDFLVNLFEDFRTRVVGQTLGLFCLSRQDAEKSRSKLICDEATEFLSRSQVCTGFSYVAIYTHFPPVLSHDFR